MLGALWSQLKHRRRRAAAVAAGILVAAVSFSLLTAATTTSTAEVRGTVARNLRPAYDILVRPPGSGSALETSKDIVRDNYLSGIFGGITLQQYAEVTKVPGVQLAAPIAMIGYILESITLPVDVTASLTRASAQVLSLTDTEATDRGLTTVPPRSAGYVYVTNDPIRGYDVPTLTTIDGTQVYGATETLAGGKQVTICPQYATTTLDSPFADYQAQDGWCWSSQNGYHGPVTDLGPGHVGAYITVTFPFLIAAIDPTAEAQLVGLNGAVVQGRYLRPDDADVVVNRSDASSQLQVPVLATTNPFVDDTDEITISRLPAAAVTAVRQNLLPKSLVAALAKFTPTPVSKVTLTSGKAYQQLLSGLSSSLLVDAYWTAAPTTYRQTANGELTPLAVTNPSSVWASNFSTTGYEQAPIDASDIGFRALHENLRTNATQLLTVHAIGEFDPAKLPGFNSLSQVPLETYYPPDVTGANVASRRALGDQPLLPDENMAGYLQEPPLMLTTLGALPAFEHDFPSASMTSPISVIRVRVGGLHGSVTAELSEIAQVAVAIRRTTGLDVDVTAGSSPTTETIALPAGHFGRPPLTLDESWIRKAVALVILSAVDDKSVALFFLILIVCGFFIANAAFAAIRARRREIGVLRCLGWPRRMIFAFTLGEVMLTGLAAGIVGTGLSAASIGVFRLDVPWERVWLVTPVAVVLAALAGLLPAVMAARGQPLDALRPAMRIRERSARPVRHLVGLALANLRRAPGRALLAAGALAVGIAALTVLLALNVAFEQGVVGSALGGFVVNQVRAVDYLSAALAIVLGAASVADVLYINFRERASEFAILNAVGWRRGDIVRVALGEGGGIGIAGTAMGTLLGMLAASAILGPNLSALVIPAVGAFIAGIIVTVIAASLVAANISRMPLAATLAEE